MHGGTYLGKGIGTVEDEVGFLGGSGGRGLAGGPGVLFGIVAM